MRGRSPCLVPASLFQFQHLSSDIMQGPKLKIPRHIHPSRAPAPRPPSLAPKSRYSSSHLLPFRDHVLLITSNYFAAAHHTRQALHQTPSPYRGADDGKVPDGWVVPTDTRNDTCCEVITSLGRAPPYGGEGGRGGEVSATTLGCSRPW